jgi:hypothetical protein
VAYFDMMNPLHSIDARRSAAAGCCCWAPTRLRKLFLEAEGQKYEIVGVVDRDAERWGSSLAGREVQSSRRLLEGDSVVLVMEPDYMSVAEQLNWLGVEPYFHWNTISIVRENGSDNRDVTPEEAEEWSKNPAYELPYEGWDDRTQYTHAMGTVDTRVPVGFDGNGGGPRLCPCRPVQCCRAVRVAALPRASASRVRRKFVSRSCRARGAAGLPLIAQWRRSTPATVRASRKRR